MLRKFTKKRVLLVGLASLIVAAAAFAYWTTSGDGTGSASTSAGDTNSLHVNETSTITGLKPGDPAQGITATVTNNGSSSAQVSSVSVSIASVDKAAGAPSGTCDATDYTLSNSPMTNGAGNVAAGATSSPFSGATLQFNNKSGANQDACKGATVNLHYTAQ